MNAIRRSNERGMADHGRLTSFHTFDGDEVALLPATAGRAIYVHVARGDIDANGVSLSGGDELRIVDAGSLTLERGRAAEVLVFDLPPFTSSAG
jgi:redox-sensitive bicupin YhaK (pirin superfamily)